jgi:hypothetical protein
MMGLKIFSLDPSSNWFRSYPLTCKTISSFILLPCFLQNIFCYDKWPNTKNNACFSLKSDWEPYQIWFSIKFLYISCFTLLSLHLIFLKFSSFDVLCHWFLEPYIGRYCNNELYAMLICMCTKSNKIQLTISTSSFGDYVAWREISFTLNIYPLLSHFNYIKTI